MSAKLNVDLGDRSYDIVIGEGLLKDVGAHCRSAGLADTCMIVTDDRVGPLYADRTVESLQNAGIRADVISLPPGETSKAQQPLFDVLSRMLDAGLDRKAFVLALGGGVVGDLAGFAAATYLRGIDFVQVPTTVLAMVDSAVGGKTGINMPQGKNLVGAFHQPRRVLADTAVLDTLAQREFIAGTAEIIKYGVIYDEAFFEWLEARIDTFCASDRAAVAEAVKRSCEIKAAVVAHDERDSGVRAILNFGHTLGHAIENSSGYGVLLHGEAVAIGMHYAARLSERVCGLSTGHADRIIKLIERAGLPLQATACRWEQLRDIMRLDKKSQAGLPRFVLADTIGHVQPGYAVEESVLEEVWHDCCQ